MPKYALLVNGKTHTVDVEADTPLLWVLRDNLRLVGTKYGCGIAQCGACTVHVNGNAIRSCTYPVSAVGKNPVTTIEGLSADGNHPLQLAWDEVDVAQCGYCQAGQIMTAAALLNKKSKPSVSEIENAMNGNICRCGTFQQVRAAIHAAANA